MQTEETRNETDVMLSIAEAAINTRAAKDGYTFGTYDIEEDREGYVISLLNALLMWCHVHGIDWQEQLVRARSFFESDTTETQQKTYALPRPTVRDLCCPKCGHTESFVIEVNENLLMFDDGTVLDGERGTEWGDWSVCRYHACDHLSKVEKFRKIKGGRHEQ